MKNEMIFFNTPEGDKKVEVLYHDENFWLTQKATVSILETTRLEHCCNVKQENTNE